MGCVDQMSCSRDDVLARERRWHDASFPRRSWLNEILYAAPAFDAVVDSAIGWLDLREGDRVLDVGVGEGKETIQFASRGVTVFSLDLSQHQLHHARSRVRAYGLGSCVHFVQADAGRLPFADGSFDGTYGKAVLHHLDLHATAHEINRSLTDHGCASFAEPLSFHPVFRLARALTPRLRTCDERPLSPADLKRFGSHFSVFSTDTHFLISFLAYVFRVVPCPRSVFDKVHGFLQKADQWLFRALPVLQGLAWYGSVYVGKGGGVSEISGD